MTKNKHATAIAAALSAVPVPSRLVEADPYLVAFSLNNPRRRRGLDIESLNALAASIKTQGLAQPILVRPLPGTRAQDTFADRPEGRPLPEFELVCGERRLRACRIAELEAIPMLVRDLTDEAALELQLVENIEREDLDPIEEAEGFELLRTKLGYSVEQIADRIGRGKGDSYVRKAIKLLALTPESREALYDGHLGRSTALLVAQYPETQQADVVEYIKGLAKNGEPAPFRTVKPLVYIHFNLDLSRAVWPLDDVDLVPAAGACSTCPKRSGAHADLFGETDSGPDSCADADCFAGKREAHVARVKAQAQKDGMKVIDGDEAKAAFPSPFTAFPHGFVRLDSVAYTQKGDDDVEREVTFGDALRSMGKKAPKPRILINPHSGKAETVITMELADKLQPEPGPNEDDPHTGDLQQDDRPEEHQALDDYHTRRAVLLRIFDAIRNRDRSDADMLLIAKALVANIYSTGDDLAVAEQYLSWDFGDLYDEDVTKEIHAKLDAMRSEDVAAIMTMIAAEIAINFSSGFSREQEVAIATNYGVDILAVRDKVAEDLERQEAAEPGELADQDA